MKYQKISQKKYCCVGACLEMILKRYGIDEWEQEDIAYELGLIVPEEEKHLYKKARVGIKPEAGYGTQIQKEEYSINHFFESNNLHFRCDYIYLEEAIELKKQLIINEDLDILICVHCGTLYDKDYADWGHMVLFDSINLDKVTILDPSEKRDYEEIPIEKLATAIKRHGIGNGAGLYIIKKLD